MPTQAGDKPPRYASDSSPRSVNDPKSKKHAFDELAVLC